MQETQFYLAILANASDLSHRFRGQEIGSARNDNLFCADPVNHEFIDKRAKMLRRPKYPHAGNGSTNRGGAVIEYRNYALLVRSESVEQFYEVRREAICPDNNDPPALNMIFARAVLAVADAEQHPARDEAGC